MKALTLTRPWAYAILHLGKRIENRSHDQFKRFRGALLIHSGKTWTGAPAWCRSRGLVDATHYQRMSSKQANPTGIVGLGEVVGHIDPHADGRPIITLGIGEPTATSAGPDRIVRYSTLDDLDFGHSLDLRWWMGKHGPVLGPVEALVEPIPCKGKLGLWTPPKEVLDQLPEGWAA